MNWHLVYGVLGALGVVAALVVSYLYGVDKATRMGLVAIQAATDREVEALTVKDHAAALLSQAMRELDEERRKSAGYFETIESVLQQSKTWQDLYRKQAVGHGNAQALMMDGIASLVAKCRAHGIDVSIPPLLREVQALYQDEHELSVSSEYRATKGKPIEKPSDTLSEGIEKASAKSAIPGKESPKTDS